MNTPLKRIALTIIGELQGAVGGERLPTVEEHLSKVTEHRDDLMTAWRKQGDELRSTTASYNAMYEARTVADRKWNEANNRADDLTKKLNEANEFLASGQTIERDLSKLVADAGERIELLQKDVDSLRAGITEAVGLMNECWPYLKDAKAAPLREWISKFEQTF